MARKRYQPGSVYLVGKSKDKWVGRYRKDVIGIDGKARRVRREVILGSKRDLPTKRLAQRRMDSVLSRINGLDYRPGRVATFEEFVERWKVEVLTAKRDKRLRFTALLHHVSVLLLESSFYALKRDAAPGVDGVTWTEYETGLGERLKDLHSRVHKGTYRAQPSKRTYIPKADGRQRPLGIAAQEDKIVQQAVVTVLNEIYEEDFLGFSYGFRPGRSQHQALDALWVGLIRKKVNWVLDADIRDFFGSISHEWLGKFIEHRIADRRILRLIRKWLRAGVSEEGVWAKTEVGTPQGAVVSPLLANVYLHYAFDLWAQHWRKHRAAGDVIIVRYA